MKGEFYENVKPIRVCKNNKEFVEPIDHGQMDRDRQEQINSAYEYIGGTEFTDRSRGHHRDYGRYLRYIFLLIIAGAISTFALDSFNIIDLGIFN